MKEINYSLKKEITIMPDNSDRKTNTNGSGHVPNKADGNIPKKK